VFYIDLPARIGGLFAYNDDLGGCIGINRKHPPTRGNWSLAHEYGHFLTTRYQADVTFTSTDYWGKISAEKFADSFARNFLMPRMGVSRRLSEMVLSHGKGVTLTDILVLAQLFKVSVEAMFRRLEELKRIPSGTWAGLRFSPEKARSALGLNAEAKQPLLPLRYRILAKKAFEEEKLTEGQLARMLRVDRVSARLELDKLSQLADQESEEGFTSVDFEPGDKVLTG
jgi:Zn-dependent peptidase ImmA (M78 family)